jgi:hypothetical protein
MGISSLCFSFETLLASLCKVVTLQGVTQGNQCFPHSSIETIEQSITGIVYVPENKTILQPES